MVQPIQAYFFEKEEKRKEHKAVRSARVKIKAALAMRSLTQHPEQEEDGSAGPPKLGLFGVLKHASAAKAAGTEGEGLKKGDDSGETCRASGRAMVDAGALVLGKMGRGRAAPNGAADSSSGAPDEQLPIAPRPSSASRPGLAAALRGGVFLDI